MKNSDFKNSEPYTQTLWLPIFVGILLFILVGIFWRFLVEQERSIEEKFPAYKNPEFKKEVNALLDKLELGEITMMDVVLNAAAVDNAQLLIDIGEGRAIAQYRQKLGMVVPKGDKPPPKPKAEPELSEHEKRDRSFQNEIVNTIR